MEVHLRHEPTKGSRSRIKRLRRFRSEGDWLDFQLEEDPRFLRRIEQSRKSLSEGKGVKLEEIPE